ncbi:MAG: replicative DNA helicase, partial [Armatimonadota bacterium]
LRPKDGEETNHRLKMLMEPELDAIQARGQQSGSITGLETGFSSLDWMLSGMQPADFLLLAARPSLGKTALATAIAANVTKKGKTTQFFSLEMSRSQVVQRMLTAEGRVDSHRVRTGQLEHEDWEKLVAGSNRLWDGECLIDDNSLITPAYMRSVCRRTKAKHGLDLVIVDYLQLMNGGAGDGKPGENRNAELSDISRSLKLLGKEFGVPVFALSQLSRNVEKRENKRPMLSDLRDSGSLEQDADVVMFLYRESYQADGGTAADPEAAMKPDETEVIIRKQRMGPTGTVKLGFVPAYARFEELADEEEI